MDFHGQKQPYTNVNIPQSHTDLWNENDFHRS